MITPRAEPVSLVLIAFQLHMPIFMFDRDNKSTMMTLGQLLPMSFGPEKLKSTDELAHGMSQ